MNEQPSLFRLGIIGGCLSHQDGMPMSKLYHRQLGKQLLEKSGVKLRINIVREFKLPYHERLDAMLAENKVDGVLLHMRIAVSRKSTLLSRYSSEGVARYYVHPFLVNRRQVGWAQVEQNQFKGGLCIVKKKASAIGAEEHLVTRPSKRAKGFSFNDLNVILGHLVGLDNWAIRDEMALLQTFAQECQARGVPFMVLGPSAVDGLPQIDRLSDKLNRELSAYLAKRNIPFCPINNTVDEDGQPNLLPDGWHLSESGHRYVANQLTPLFNPWVEQILTSNQSISASVV